MYLVVLKDPARAAAIAAALGGEPAARTASDLYAAASLVKELGRPAAVLVATDEVDDVIADRVDQTPGLRDVPVLFDGGATGPVYRAFVNQFRSGRAFHHLVAASPEEAARALVQAASGPPPPPWYRRPMVPVVVGVAGLYATARLSPGLLPGWLGTFLRIGGGGLMLGLVFGTPMVVALAKGIRPSKGAVAWAVFIAVMIADALWRATRVCG